VVANDAGLIVGHIKLEVATLDRAILLDEIACHFLKQATRLGLDGTIDWGRAGDVDLLQYCLLNLHDEVVT
jgi:hypothetical protein